MYNVVLIGCGHMGSVHLDDIYMMKNVCVYGVVDTNRERAEMFAKKYGAKSFGVSYMRYMEDENTDIIICATYPETHLEVLKRCVKYKKHLLCEKPIASNIKDAKEFVKIVKSADIKVQIGYILRFNETYRTVAKMIQGGKIGSPLIIRMCQNQHVMDWEKYGALLRNASPLVDCGIHYIDVCRWFTGAEVIDTGGIAAKIDKETPENSYNYGMMTMRFSDGSTAYYEAGWGNTIAAKNVKEFIGPLGRIRITERENRADCHEEGDLIEFYQYPQNEYKIINVNCKRRPTGAQLEHLIKMIEGGEESSPTIDDVYKSLDIAIKTDEQLREKYID
ncbi:MAG: Gfo/Idh/MocA family oxidoreductase [Eubacteriales bacterium]|nr:Gfo/Idh/MocA family oxidoreductase [Eubacteriales bacterium]